MLLVHLSIQLLYELHRFWACSAGLKNTVPADCCERKILFWQDVNSDSVRGKTSQPAGFKPAEHALLPRRRLLASCSWPPATGRHSICLLGHSCSCSWRLLACRLQPPSITKVEALKVYWSTHDPPATTLNPFMFCIYGYDL